MVGISDIPCVGNAVDRISNATVDAVFRGLRYMLCYKRIVDDLNSEIEKVKVQEEEVSRKAVADIADGKTIKDHVIKWQKETEETKMRADKLSKQRPSWNPLNRLRLGRKAAHEAKNVAELTASGEKLLATDIAFLPPNPNMPDCDTKYQTFGSREEAYGKLWEALKKEDEYPIIGIYGMPGVGKTRMMEQAWEDAKTKKIFDKVARANVGDGNIDAIKLQKQLAGYLDCHLESEDNQEKRAFQLKNSLINAGKTLVILDDVWDHIPLQNIGIPLTEGIPKGCKILLTSRGEDVCLKNHCKNPIKINHLTDVEGWDMFTNIVGISKIYSFRDKSLAKKVCNKCGGLPLLINAVGNALKLETETEDSWMDALSQLEKCDFEVIDGTKSAVYNCIKLSFDKLPPAQKICLLFCSLFPEDAEIEIKMLEDFAKGSQLLDRARIVRGVVGKLKSASLLLEGETHRTVKLHDIIRDVATSIAARDEQHAFCFIRGGSCFPIDVNYRTRRLLQFVESDNFQFRKDTVCPDLHTLWLERNNKPQQFPKSFFEGIGNLKNLVLKDMEIFPEHMSVQTFNNLSVLILEGCDLNEISLSNVPENLETLRISECRIQNPLDLAKLKSLRKLQVLFKDEIKMVQYSISTLSGTLEELHIPGGFKICDVEGKSISTPISSELNKLTALKSLNIRLEDSESCPNENIVANLLDFIVNMGRGFHMTASNLYMRSVSLSNTSIEGGRKVLVERAEYVCIKYCNDIEHLEARMAQDEIQQSQPLTSFSNLTQLFIFSCTGLKYLFSASVAECLVQLEKLDIWICPRLEVVIRNDERAIDGLIIYFPKLKVLNLRELPSLRSFYGESRADNTSIPDSLFHTTVVFSALETLTINSCRGLKYLFSASVAECLVQLEKLHIFDCPIVEVVIRNDERAIDGLIINFPKLKYLGLDSLPSLRSFYGESRADNTSIPDSLFHTTVVFSALETLNIFGLNISEIWEKNCDSFYQLKCLEISDCDYLKFAIPHTMLPTLQKLEVLTIRGCESMTSEVESSSNECSNGESTFVALQSIQFYNMPTLTHIRLNSSRRNSYPNLQELTIIGCKSLRNVFLPSIVGHLKHLQILIIYNCEIMSEIIGDEEKEEDINCAFDFPQLTELQLSSLPNFKSFCFARSAEASGRYSYSNLKVSFPKLVTLRVDVKSIKLDEIELGGRDESTANIKKLVVHCHNKVQLPSTWQFQFPNIEELSLKNCWWSGNIMEAFSSLKKLSIDSCYDMEHLAFLPQSQPLALFSTLTSLVIVSCSELKYLFSASVANCLVQLQQLSVENCPTLEVVIRNESNGVIPKFPKLKKLTLANLESLRRFYGENRDRSSSSTTITETAAESESLFDGMVEYPTLETLTILSLKISEIWGTNCSKENSFCRLQTLNIYTCRNLEFAIPLAMLPTFQNLKELNMVECESMTSEVESSSSSSNECLPQLVSLSLYNMPGLTQTGLNSRGRNLYPNLKRLNVSDCENLKSANLDSKGDVVEYLRDAKDEDAE